MKDPNPQQAILRHGVMRFLGIYDVPPGLELKRNLHVIARTDRGVESGIVLSEADDRAINALAEPTHGKILRVAAPEDEVRVAEYQARRGEYLDTAQGLSDGLRLPMQFIDVERLFGGERIVFYYLSEIRVDFRELVRQMAREFQMRIELRQIGVRDEAKLLADYGDCGKPVCCNTHMPVMPPVSMRMAKLQKSTLDPTKISGRCGRLKCCLRFEQDVYEEMLATLPPIQSRILTRKGQARVLAHEILAQRLLVEFEDGLRQPIALDEVLTRM